MSHLPASRQLALALPHVENFARDDFLEGPSNAAALCLIDRWPDWPARVLALTGPEGSGKSHLASIWAEASGARFHSARALGDAHPPTALATGALVIEDLAPGQFEERALFHLLNLAREHEAFMLITARSAPAGWALRLVDLESRLRAMPVVALHPPDEALLRAIMVKLFADRQVPIDESLVAFLLTRVERSFAAAREAVATLDREGLRLKRPVTRALAVEVLRDK